MRQIIYIRKKYLLNATFLVIMVLASACNAGVKPSPAETNAATNSRPSEAALTPSPTQTRITPLTEEVLKNATYQGIYLEAVQLTNGNYTGPPSVTGAASKPTINFTSPYALGDLNADGVKDAAVFLVENSGGSGSFVYLAVVLNQQGKPENVASLLLGDRVQVQSVAIAEDQIIIKLKQQGPNDPMCCPTQGVENTYELQGNILMLIAIKILG